MGGWRAGSDLVNEWRVAGITTILAANRYLRERFIPALNVVSRDNVVVSERLPLQLSKQPGRRTCAGLRVLIRRHLNGHHTVWYGGRCLGRYDHHGRPVAA